MVRAAAAKKPDPKPDRRKLAEELVDLQVEHRAVFEKVDGLKASLKLIATQAGDGFREVFAGRGQVSVSGAREKEFKGDLPELDGDKWAGLSKAERNTLVKQGIVKLVPTWSAAYYGRADVKLF